jgi:hypothetical protein
MLMNLKSNNLRAITPRISNGGLLVVHRFMLRTIVSVPGQVVALNFATAHTRKRYGA